MRIWTLGLAVVALGGCGQILGIGDVKTGPEPGTDASGIDVPIECGTTGPAIVISGDTLVIGTQAMPRSPAIIDVIRISDGCPLATTTPDASDAFSVRVPTDGTPLDAYLRVTYAGYLPTLSYLIPMLENDSADNHVYVITQDALDEIAKHAKAPQPGTAGFVLAQLFAENQPATEATGSLSPSSSSSHGCYSDAGFQPDCMLHATAHDGMVWFFGVAPGTVSLTGQLASGTPLRPRQATVEAGTFTFLGLEP